MKRHSLRKFRMGAWVGRVAATSVALVVALSAQSVKAESFTCPWMGSGAAPTIQITQAVGSRTGLPGAVFVAMHNPDKTAAYSWDGAAWQPVTGGLMPTQIYRNGLPSSVQITASMAYNAGGESGVVSRNDTYQFAGWSLYVGVGALDARLQAMVADRIKRIPEMKAKMLAAGKPWNPRAEDIDEFRLALVSGDVRTNNNYRLVTVVPSLQCYTND